MTTTLTTCQSLGRARTQAAMAHGGASAHGAAPAHGAFPVAAAQPNVSATNPWRVGVVQGPGSGSKKYASTRITPGRLEGVT